MHEIYNIEFLDRSKNEIDLAQYQGKYILIVNTASKCGFTKQFSGLETIYQDFKKDLVVIGFPSNDFKQEFVDVNEAADACQINFGVTFPLMDMVHVRGKNISPLFKYLTTNSKGRFSSGVKWNFTKFLIAPNGEIIKRFAPKDTPQKIVTFLQDELNK